MGVNYGNFPCTFYRDFETWKELEPSSGGIGGPITYDRNSTATYIGSNGYLQTAGVNQPRFGYEYDSNGDLVYRGLLIEPTAGNNYLLYSEDFSQNVWTTTSATISSSSTKSPDGINNAQKLSLSSAGGSIKQSYTTNYTNANTSYHRNFHLSVMVKASECSYLNMVIDNGTDSLSCYYNLTNGTVGSNSADINNMFFVYKHIANIGNGWYRCFLCVRDDNLTNKTYTFSYKPTTSASSLTGSSGDGLYIWGGMAHYEANYYPPYQQTAKSYIKTTASALSNASEACYVGNLSNASLVSRILGSYNNQQISLFGHFSLPYNFKTGITQAYLGIGIPPTSLYYRQLNNVVNILLRRTGFNALDFGSYSILNDNKAILTYGAGLGAKSCMNSNTIYSSASASTGILDPIFYISFGGDAYFKKVFCMPTILNNNQLSRLTTL